MPMSSVVRTSLGSVAPRMLMILRILFAHIFKSLHSIPQNAVDIGNSFIIDKKYFSRPEWVKIIVRCI